MAKVPGPKKLTLSDCAIYGTLLVLFVIACAFIGTAMDCTLGADGSPDLTRISEGMNKVIANPDLIMTALANRQSYALKTVFENNLISAIRQSQDCFLYIHFSKPERRNLS